MKHISTFLMSAAALVLLIACINSLILYYALEQVRGDAHRVNLSGQVRGLLQRVVKLERSHAPDDALLTEVSVRIHALVGKQGWEDDDLPPTTDLERQALLRQMDRDRNALAVKPMEGEGLETLMPLEDGWHALRRTILAYRVAKTPELERRMMEESERCWNWANDMVLAVQREAESKQRYFTMALGLIVVDILALGMIIWLVKRFVRDRLERLAHHDPLTGAYNRFTFGVLTDLRLKEAQRHNTPVSLLIFDLDHFKRVNDHHGHDAGDRVLVAVAEEARRTLRACDALFRMGGEEFAVLAGDVDLAGARVLAEKLRRRVAEMASPAPGVGRVTVSVGVAQLQPEEGWDFTYRRADAALYRAKNGGRNQVALDDPPSEAQPAPA
ncbi:MAG: GGDEF domain-containing protein [Magnetococcales bacterium]|nr:GGDEF domain-containing protein [Magnetococcales bacterium]